MKIYQIIFLLLIFTLTACTKSPQHEYKQTADSSHVVQPPTHTETETDTLLAGLTLNNGKKWAMDDHTRKMISEMKAAVAGADTATFQERKATGQKLKDQLEVLIKGCTMSGDAHNQLHTFLGAYMPAVTALADEPDSLASIEQLKKVEHLLHQYETFFE